MSWVASDHRRARGHRRRLRLPRRHVPSPSATSRTSCSGGDRDDRNRGRLRAPDRRDRPVRGLRQRGRRGRDDAAPAAGRSRMALVAGDLAALLVTTAIGFVQALVITKAGVPSFVVTLAGLIWSGVVLILTTQASEVGRSGSRTRPSASRTTSSRGNGGLDRGSRGGARLRARAAQHRAPAARQRPLREALLADRAPGRRARARHVRRRLVLQPGSRRALRDPDPHRLPDLLVVHRRAALQPPSTRWAGTPRRRGGPGSTSTACASPSS